LRNKRTFEFSGVNLVAAALNTRSRQLTAHMNNPGCGWVFSTYLALRKISRC